MPRPPYFQRFYVHVQWCYINNHTEVRQCLSSFCRHVFLAMSFNYVHGHPSCGHARLMILSFHAGKKLQLSMFEYSSLWTLDTTVSPITTPENSDDFCRFLHWGTKQMACKSATKRQEQWKVNLVTVVTVLRVQHRCVRYTVLYLLCF